MKILVIGPTYPFLGGISHYNTLLCKSLSKTHDVILISYKRRYPSFIYPGRDQIDKSKKKIETYAEYVLDSINPITWIMAFVRIKREKADLLIFHWVTPFLAPMFSTIAFLTRRFTKTRVLCICHNVLSHERRTVDAFLAKSTFKRSDFFVVHSKEDHENLKTMLPRVKVRQTVLPTYDIFTFNKISKLKAKKKLRLENKIILYFGFVREYKGLKYLIEAMPKVLEKVNVNLLIVGEFWEDKKRYLDQIKKLGIETNVKIVDMYVPNEDVGLYFSAADVVVLPYTSATQSAIVQIAYGFDKPVITTNVGGLPDVVENGRTGLLVKAGDSKELSKAIIYYFENNMEKEFERNIKSEKKKFSWDRMVEVIEELGEEL